jgi:hypothetical protein
VGVCHGLEGVHLPGEKSVNYLSFLSKLAIEGVLVGEGGSSSSWRDLFVGGDSGEG